MCGDGDENVLEKREGLIVTCPDFGGCGCDGWFREWFVLFCGVWIVEYERA